MLKLEDINNHIYFELRRAQTEAMETERLGKIHVSDIIKPCMRNVIYKKFIPDTGKDEPLTYEQAKKIPDGDERHLDIIYGSIDDVIEVGGKWIICDKKTTGAIDYFSKASSKPSDSHKDQINRYRVLLEKCYGITADFGCVIYISNKIEKEKRDIPRPISFKLAPIEETLQDMKEKAMIIKNSILLKTLPERTRCFLCDGMCDYASMCFQDNRTHIE
jgi:CRISPR/Cas system-associated exonuclease Cas4 (RecB family)